METPRFTPDFKAMINIVFWNSLGMFFIEFLTPIIAKYLLNATNFQIGLTVSVQIAGYLISSTFGGPLADRLSKKKLVMFGSFGRAFGYLMFYASILSNNLIMLTIGTFSIGFGVGFFWIPLNALLAEKSHKDVRSNAYGLRSSRLALGNALGAIIGFLIYNMALDMGLSPIIVYSPILFFAAANIFAGILFSIRVDESSKIEYQDGSQSENLDDNLVPLEIDILEAPSLPQNNSSHSKNKILLYGIGVIMFVLFLSSTNGSLARPFMQNYLLDNVNSDTEAVSLAYLPPAVVSMILAPYLGKIADKIYPAVAITISSICGAILTYIIIHSNSLLVISILWTFDNAVVHLAGLSIANVVSRISAKNRGKLFGSLSIFENIGGIVGPLLGGLSSDLIDDKAPFLISIGVELFLIPFYWLALKLILPNLEEKKSQDLKLVKASKTEEIEK